MERTFQAKGKACAKTLSLETSVPRDQQVMWCRQRVKMGHWEVDSLVSSDRTLGFDLGGQLQQEHQ